MDCTICFFWPETQRPLLAWREKHCLVIYEQVFLCDTNVYLLFVLQGCASAWISPAGRPVSAAWMVTMATL